MTEKQKSEIWDRIAQILNILDAARDNAELWIELGKVAQCQDWRDRLREIQLEITGR